MDEKYTMRVVRGSLTDPEYLDQKPHKIVQAYEDDPSWDRLMEVELTMPEIHEVQKLMTKHYEGPQPWYMDGWKTDDRDAVICAFGADDGEGGRIFEFRRNDREAFHKIVDYAMSKGIPQDQMDFLEVYSPKSETE